MTNLDNLPTIEVNDQSPSTVENLTKPSVVQLKESDESIRKRKLMWIVISAIIIIIVLTVVITIPLVFVGKKKMNTNTSTTTVSTIVTTITTVTTTATTTVTEVLSHNSTINNNTKWKQTGIIVAGGHGIGDGLNQLNWPTSFYLDDDYQAIYISDCYNHRVMEWEFNAMTGRIIAGGNGKGNETNQLANPHGIIVDKDTNSLIICDRGNKRIVSWSRQNNMNGDIIISDYACYDVAMDKDRYLYVVNDMKSEVTRWKIGDDHGVIVAGGNGIGPDFHQFDDPRHIFVDENYSVYVSDLYNHRVMKWMKDEKKGIVVVGDRTEGSAVRSITYPLGITVDQLGNVYVAEPMDKRVTRWIKGHTEGSDIVDGNEPNCFNNPQDLSFDKYGNLYVLDSQDGRTFKFLIDSN